MRELIIITGQTGVNIGRALSKLCKSLGANYEKMDGFLKDAHIQKHPNDPDNQMIDTPSGMQYLLFKPKAYLEMLWREAWSSCLRKACLSTVDPIFVAMHTVLYHSRSREFFSCADVKHIKDECAANDTQVTKVITFLDDIYDVYRRLREPEQLLAPVPTTDPFRSIIDAIQYLILLLVWRSVENMTASQIAMQLGVPHYLVAVKHPISVAHDLVIGKKTPVYLSHPISEVRSLQKQGESEKAKKVIAEIQKLTTALTKNDHILPFCPTTIDELIIAKDESDEYVPILEQRWPFGKADDVLFVKPTNPSLNPLDPDGTWDTIVQESKEKAQAISVFLSHLHDWVSDETNARDRKLVEQSRDLVVYRPYFNGAEAHGVLQEIKHRADLVECDVCTPTEKECFVLSPHYDLGQWRITKLVSEYLADKAIDNRGRPSTQLDLAKLKRQLQNQIDVMTDLGTRNIGGDRLNKLVRSASSISYFNDLPTFKHPLDGFGLSESRLQLANRWAEIAKRLSEEDVVGEKLYEHDLYLRESLTPAQFVKKVEKWIRKK